VQPPRHTTPRLTVASGHAVVVADGVVDAAGELLEHAAGHVLACRGAGGGESQTLR